MAIDVMGPKRKPGNDGAAKLLTLGGMAVGAFGGPAGMAAGGQVGSLLGGFASQPESEAPQPIQTSAIERRLSSLDNTPQAQIRNSIDSLKYVQDDGLRAELAKPLMQADYLARNQKPGQV